MYELEVEGMSCGGCASSVTKAIQTLDRDAKVEVDLSGKKLRVDTSANLEAVASAITDAGYPVVASRGI